MNAGERSERDRTRREVEHFLVEPAPGHNPAAAQPALVDALTQRVAAATQHKAGCPESVGPYRIERLLGEGGMGVVFLGRHERTGALAAVKVVAESEEEAARLLEEEARALGAVQSPHVVRVIDQGTIADHVWLATEYVPGHDLRRWLDQEPVARATGQSKLPRYRGLPLAVNTPARLELLVGWFRDLSRTLTELHAQEFIHRDVKPANIVIGQGGFPYLIDFGLTQLEGLDVPGILAGTIPYMSPEQVAGGYLSLRPSSDLYSLAVTFYEALVGARLVEGERGRALHAVVFSEIPRISRANRSVPESLDAVFARALARNPDERYPGGEELAGDLEAWLAAGKATRLPMARSRRWAITAAGLTAFAVVSWLVGSAWSASAAEARVLGTLRELEARGTSAALDEAVDIVIREKPRRAGSQSFRDVAALVTRSSAPDRVGRLLRAQSLWVGSSALGLSRRFQRQAGELLTFNPLEPGLFFQQGFHALLESRPADAQQFLAQSPEPAKRAPLLRALGRAIDCALATTPATQSFVPAWVTPEELAIQGMGLLWPVEEHRCAGTKAAIDALLEAIDRTWRQTPRVRVLDGVHLVALMAQDRFADAAHLAQDLLKDTATEDERVGLLLLGTESAVVSASQQVPPDLRSLPGLGMDAILAESIHAGAIGRIAGNLALRAERGQLVWEVASGWIAAVPRPQPPNGPVPPGLIELMMMVVVRPPPGSERVVSDLAESIMPLEPNADLAQVIACILEHHAFASFDVAEGLLGSPDERETARVYARRSRAAATRYRGQDRDSEFLMLILDELEFSLAGSGTAAEAQALLNRCEAAYRSLPAPLTTQGYGIRLDRASRRLADFLQRASRPASQTSGSR